MRTRSVKVAVIGAGTAGLAARREAEKHGASVLMSEGGPYGTTCARVGCMPSKLLIAAADVAHTVAGAAAFGIRVPAGVRIDGRQVLERVRRERDRFVGFVLESVEAIAPEKRLRGTARFVGPTTLAVDDHTRVEAGTVVIATGSSPAPPPPALAGLGERMLLSEDVFELADLPESVAVIGAGVIGLELGQALHRLGVRVAVFSRSTRISHLTDPAVCATAAGVFGAELELHLDSSVEAVADGAGVVVRWRERGGSAGEARFERLLLAIGRLPNLAGLDLERAGVALDTQGVPRFDPRTMQCGDLPIFFAGDVDAYRPVLHEAADEGHIAGRNAATFPDVRAMLRRTPLAIAFTQPNLAMVGARFADLDPAAVEIGAVSYADQGRARVMGENAGLVRIYANKDCGTLIGAEMCGPRVEHTAHLLAWAIQQRLTVGQALAMPVYHPVIEEGIRTALRDLCARLHLAAPERKLDLDCGPGT